MTPTHRMTSLYPQELSPRAGLMTIPTTSRRPVTGDARDAARALTCRLHTDVGTLHLIRGRDPLATGFLAVHPRLSPHHATPAVTVRPCGQVQFDGVYLHHALQPFLELEIQSVVSLHLDQLRALPVPEGMLGVGEQMVRMAVGTGEAAIRKEDAYLTVFWESGQHEYRWAMFQDSTSALDLQPICPFTEQNQTALGVFHQQLTAAYQQPYRLTPIAIGLAALQLQREDRQRVTLHHQQHWAQFTVQHVRRALSI